MFENSLFVADTNNHRLLEVDIGTKKVQEIQVQEFKKTSSNDQVDSVNVKDVLKSKVSLLKGGNGSLKIGVKLESQDQKLNPEAPSLWKIKSLPDGWSSKDGMLKGMKSFDELCYAFQDLLLLQKFVRRMKGKQCKNEWSSF